MYYFDVISICSRNLKTEVQTTNKSSKQLIFFQITWIDDRGLVLTDGVRTVQELMEDGKRYVTISILKFVATIQHHGRNFTCQAQNSANRHPASVSTR